MLERITRKQFYLIIVAGIVLLFSGFLFYYSVVEKTGKETPKALSEEERLNEIIQKYLTAPVSIYEEPVVDEGLMKKITAPVSVNERPVVDEELMKKITAPESL